MLSVRGCLGFHSEHMQRREPICHCSSVWNEPDNLSIQACGNCQGRLSSLYKIMQIVTVAVRVDVTSSRPETGIRL